tara:strand:+ start:373 stop:678 length:306 start_codon:yes stop_codon:yes gene_type:complete
MKFIAFSCLITALGFILLWGGLIIFDEISPYQYDKAINYVINSSVVFVIALPFYLRKKWDDDFIFILLRRIAFSLNILKKRTEEKIEKTKDKMRDDMGEWH